MGRAYCHVAEVTHSHGFLSAHLHVMMVLMSDAFSKEEKINEP